MRQKQWLLLILVFLAAGSDLAFADTYSSSNFKAVDPVVTGGGGYSTSNNFRLWSSLAQPAIGTSTSASFGGQGGFLYFSDITVTTPTTPVPPATGGAANSPEETQATVEEFIRKMRREGVPVPEAPCGRSDYNCDGRVDLRDLSIVLAKPEQPVLKTLSILFTDWTSRLPIFRGERERERERAGEPFRTEPRISRERGLAQVESVLGTTSRPAPKISRISFISFFGKIVRGVVSVVTSLVRLILKPFALLF